MLVSEKHLVVNIIVITNKDENRFNLAYGVNEFDGQIQATTVDFLMTMKCITQNDNKIRFDLLHDKFNTSNESLNDAKVLDLNVWIANNEEMSGHFPGIEK
jgi:hypothetical protein